MKDQLQADRLWAIRRFEDGESPDAICAACLVEPEWFENFIHDIFWYASTVVSDGNYCKGAFAAAGHGNLGVVPPLSRHPWHLLKG